MSLQTSAGSGNTSGKEWGLEGDEGKLEEEDWWLSGEGMTVEEDWEVLGRGGDREEGEFIGEEGEFLGEEGDFFEKTWESDGEDNWVTRKPEAFPQPPF